jgi:hypothetical protein
LSLAQKSYDYEAIPTPCFRKVLINRVGRIVQEPIGDERNLSLYVIGNLKDFLAPQ